MESLLASPSAESEEGEEEAEGRRTYSVEPSGLWNPVLIIVGEESAEARTTTRSRVARAARRRWGRGNWGGEAGKEGRGR